MAKSSVGPYRLSEEFGIGGGVEVSPGTGRSERQLDWEAVKRLFVGARAQTPDRLEAWLASTGADPAVLAEVRSLIEALERAGGFLEEPGLPSVSAMACRLDGIGNRAVPRFAAGDRLGRYEIAGLLGAGGMGEVYRASDPRLDRTVVLKVLPAQMAAFPEWRDRLEREARAVSALKHPHVCSLYDIGREGDVDFLVMEHLDGETLADRLRRGAVPMADLLAWGVQIASALDAAHQHGIVHRDLKPANIMLTPSGAKLLDFGVAKTGLPPPSEAVDPAAPGPRTASITQHGELVGTAEYMAPEQIDGRPVDARADIFSFGAVLYEMTTGLKAFGAEDRASVFEAVRVRRMPPLRRIRRRAPRSLDRVVRTCLSKEPGARYQTVAALRDDLTVVALAERRFRRGRWLAAAVLAVAAGIGPTWLALKQQQPATTDPGGARVMLAVLPFANQSGDPGQDYLSEGLTDELITELGRLHPERLGVIAHTSVARYKEMRGDASSVARDLGVDYFIEGSAARTGTRLRIAVRLARAGDQTQVWAYRYERELVDVLMLQAEMARSIAREVTVALTPERRAQLDARTAIDPAAIEHYLKGRYFGGKRTREGLLRAVAEFEAATRKHAYAAAHAGIADSYLLLAYYSYIPPERAFSQARAAAMKALELDSGLAEAHVSLAGIYDDYDHRWADAEAEYREALRLNANYPTAHQWYANHLVGQGRVAEAQARILRARELDPLSLIIQVNVANIFLLSREYERAIEECRKALEMEPRFVTARWVLGRAYELSGRFPEAIAEFERGLALEPDSTLLRAALARACALSGASERAQSLLRELTASASRRYVSSLDLALVQAALGNTDQAFAYLNSAVRERANLLIYPKVDPAYDSLRGDPRFSALLRTLGLQ